MSGFSRLSEDCSVAVLFTGEGAFHALRWHRLVIDAGRVARDPEGPR